MPARHYVTSQPSRDQLRRVIRPVTANHTGTSAGFWLGGSMPPWRLRRRKFRKFDYEMVHSEVYLNKYVVSTQHSAVLYTCLPWLLSKYNINTNENCFFCTFSLFNFSSVFPGGQLTPFAAICGRSCDWPNPTHYKWKNLDPTRPNTTNNGAYSLIVTYFYTQNLSRTFSLNQASTYSCALLISRRIFLLERSSAWCNQILSNRALNALT